MNEHHVTNPPLYLCNSQTSTYLMKKFQVQKIDTLNGVVSHNFLKRIKQTADYNWFIGWLLHLHACLCNSLRGTFATCMIDPGHRTYTIKSSVTNIWKSKKSCIFNRKFENYTVTPMNQRSTSVCFFGQLLCSNFRGFSYLWYHSHVLNLYPLSLILSRL
jgi:hypothetical protein